MPAPADKSNAGHKWSYLDQGQTRDDTTPPLITHKVERSHRIDAEEFYRLLDGQVIDDAEVVNQRLEEWEDYYNFDRPH